MIPVSAVSSVNVKPLHKRVFAREIAAAKLQAGNQTATELVVPVYDIANSPASEDNLVDDDKEEPKAKEAVNVKPLHKRVEGEEQMSGPVFSGIGHDRYDDDNDNDNDDDDDNDNFNIL